MRRYQSIYRPIDRKRRRAGARPDALDCTLGAIDAIRRMDDRERDAMRKFYQSAGVCHHDVTWIPGITAEPRDMTVYCERCGVQVSADGLEILGVGTSDAPPAMLPALQELHKLRRLVHRIRLEYDGTEWNADTLDATADALRSAGFTIAEPITED